MNTPVFGNLHDINNCTTFLCKCKIYSFSFTIAPLGKFTNYRDGTEELRKMYGIYRTDAVTLPFVFVEYWC